MNAMRVDQFTLQVTRCSGHIQSSLVKHGVETGSIMGNLATKEVYAMRLGKAHDDVYEIVRVGVDADSFIRVEIEPRWTRPAFLTKALRLAAALVLVAALVGLAYGLGFEVGVHDSTFVEIQLPTI